MKRFYLIGAMFGAGAFWYWAMPSDIEPPETVVIAAGEYSYRLAGQFRTGERVVAGPVETRIADTDFEIMKYLVSEAEYSACVADGDCYASASNSAEMAQVDVSFVDAVAYAQWFSAETGQDWRLPRDDEWMRAAGDRFVEDVVEDTPLETGPPKRWMAEYLSAGEGGVGDPVRRSLGSFGENDMGVADISGNVWEWTGSCFQIGELATDGSIAELTEYCNVRAAQGRHRAYIIDFIRDAKVGGCAVGLPPDYLGFRLVRDL